LVKVYGSQNVRSREWHRTLQQNEFSGNCAIITAQDGESKEGRIKALGVSRIGLFGSFIRGEQQPDSDIDLLVEFEAG
jgi:predicted nucleotidyltransferase